MKIYLLIGVTDSYLSSTMKCEISTSLCLRTSFLIVKIMTSFLCYNFKWLFQFTTVPLFLPVAPVSSSVSLWRRILSLVPLWWWCWGGVYPACHGQLGEWEQLAETHPVNSQWKSMHQFLLPLMGGPIFKLNGKSHSC